MQVRVGADSRAERPHLTGRMSTCAPCRGSFTKILVAVMVAALLVELHFNLLADLKRRTLKESSNLVRLFGVHPGQSWSARRRYTWNESWTETEVTPAPRNLCPLVPPNLGELTGST